VDFYRHLHDTKPAPMGAYLEYPFGAVLSSSPERLLEVEGATCSRARSRERAGAAPIREDARGRGALARARRTAPRT
jgi:para-aminobenzoate synthetase